MPTPPDRRRTSADSQPSAERRAPDITRQPVFRFYCGASGTGKSTSVKRYLQDQANNALPLLIFDPKHEYLPHVADCGESGFLSDVDACAQGIQRGARMRPSFDPLICVRQFDRFCQVAHALARHRGGCIVLVDELHTVVSAGHGPAHWERLVATGRADGVQILACAIRVAAIDKGFFSNVTYIRTGRLATTADCQTIAASLMVPWQDVAQLPNLAYIERDMGTGTAAARGEITF